MAFQFPSLLSPLSSSDKQNKRQNPSLQHFSTLIQMCTPVKFFESPDKRPKDIQPILYNIHTPHKFPPGKFEASIESSSSSGGVSAFLNKNIGAYRNFSPSHSPISYQIYQDHLKKYQTLLGGNCKNNDTQNQKEEVITQSYQEGYKLKRIEASDKLGNESDAKGEILQKKLQIVQEGISSNKNYQNVISPLKKHLSNEKQINLKESVTKSASLIEEISFQRHSKNNQRLKNMCQPKSKKRQSLIQKQDIQKSDKEQSKSLIKEANQPRNKLDDQLCTPKQSQNTMNICSNLSKDSIEASKGAKGNILNAIMESFSSLESFEQSVEKHSNLSEENQNKKIIIQRFCLEPSESKQSSPTQLQDHIAQLNLCLMKQFKQLLDLKEKQLKQDQAIQQMLYLFPKSNTPFNKKSFQCRFCSKSFPKSCSLGGHISRVHKGKVEQKQCKTIEMSLPKREESSKLMSQAKMELKELSSCSPTEKKNNQDINEFSQSHSNHSNENSNEDYQALSKLCTKKIIKEKAKKRKGISQKSISKIKRALFHPNQREKENEKETSQCQEQDIEKKHEDK